MITLFLNSTTYRHLSFYNEEDNLYNKYEHCVHVHCTQFQVRGERP